MSVSESMTVTVSVAVSVTVSVSVTVTMTVTMADTCTVLRWLVSSSGDGSGQRRCLSEQGRGRASLLFVRYL